MTAYDSFTLLTGEDWSSGGLPPKIPTTSCQAAHGLDAWDMPLLLRRN